VRLCHVEETKYLHAKLATAGKPFPSFRPSSFRSLELPAEQEEQYCAKLALPIAEFLKQDKDLAMLLERLKYLTRGIRELEIAREIINLHISIRMATLPPP